MYKLIGKSRNGSGLHRKTLNEGCGNLQFDGMTARIFHLANQLVDSGLSHETSWNINGRQGWFQNTSLGDIVKCFGLPIIGWLCNIIAMKFYELDKERMVEVQKNIAEMKEQ